MTSSNFTYIVVAYRTYGQPHSYLVASCEKYDVAHTIAYAHCNDRPAYYCKIFKSILNDSKLNYHDETNNYKLVSEVGHFRKI